jgi:predicted RNA-binding protein (virulence factor B family)
VDFVDLLGRFATLYVRRIGPPGAFLAEETVATQAHGEPVVLLPGREIPDGAREGDAIEVFLYLDSEDRPVATTASPKIALGEVGFLEVTDTTRFGAFVDWGLAKELLVPFGEQTRAIAVGERHPIGLMVDDSGRLAGTMRVAEMLRESGDFTLGEWVEGEAWRNEPELGLFVIVERAFVGLVPASEPHRLSRGEAARFRVTHVHPDGKIELSHRAPAHLELEGDARAVLAKLTGADPPRVGDRSSPEDVRAHFGLSKKAFKRAAGRLLREGAVVVDADGFLRARPR